VVVHVIAAPRVLISTTPPPDPVERSLLRRGDGKVTPRCVVTVAGAQGGSITRAQLLRLGCTGTVIDGWIKAGWLIPIHQGVYAVGHLPRTHFSRWWGGVLACGRNAKTSHRAAAAAHALLRPHPRVDVTAPTRRRRRGLAVHRAEVAAVYIDGLPCTTVARTLVDIAGCVPYGVLESAVRQAQVRGVLSIEEIGDVLRDCPRPRGISSLRAILEDPVALQPTRSSDERTALRALLAAGWPRPRVNRPIPGTTERVDFHWPDRRLVLEIDGPTHELSSVQRARDQRRDDQLRRLGWRVVRLPADCAEAAPAALASELSFEAKPAATALKSDLAQ
jgi:very-short-patch-repair endonuclease